MFRRVRNDNGEIDMLNDDGEDDEEAGYADDEPVHATSSGCLSLFKYMVEVFSTSRYLSQLAPLSWLHVLLAVTFVYLVKFGVSLDMYRFPRIPDPVADLGIAPENVDRNLLDTDQFVTIRARNSLKNMTAFGVRPMGSIAAEVYTVDWYLRQFKNLEKLHNSQPNRTSDFGYSLDHALGWFSIYGSTTSAYLNITNLIARVDPIRGDSKNAVLMNCHFDSMFDAMAASDDGVNCAIMLEIIRALLSSDSSLKHSVIFLFNGGEEQILLGSHAFLLGQSEKGGSHVGHPWAKDIKTFINLEAAGSGGREILFQTGPGKATSRLVRAYSAAPYPFGNVVGQEVFQAGLVPSDTDFRIFRDYGHIPGIDIAFYRNGFVYHTKYDTEERIPDGTIQRAGSNFLAVVRNLASSDLTTMPSVSKGNQEGWKDKLVYFDVLSLFMVLYPLNTIGIALNLAAVAGSLIRIGFRIFSLGSDYFKVLAVSIFCQLLAVAASAGTCISIAYILAESSASMFWYSSQWLLVPVYSFPGIIAAFLVKVLFFKLATTRLTKTADYSLKCKLAYEAAIDTLFLLGSIILVVGIIKEIASVYVVMISILIPLILFTITDLIRPIARIKSPAVLLTRHAIVTIIPTVYFFYVSDLLLQLFIPIMGRSDNNGELTIAIIVLALFIPALLCHGPLVELCGGNVAWLFPIFGAMSAASFLALFFSHLGNPFSIEVYKAEAVRVQRSVTQYTLYMDESGVTQAGIWFFPQESRGASVLKGYSRELDDFFQKSRTPCQDSTDLKRPQCTLPNIYPIVHFGSSGTYWRDVSNSSIINLYTWPSVVQVQNSPHMMSEKVYRYQFKISTGETAQGAMYLQVQQRVKLMKWNFANEVVDVTRIPSRKFTLSPWPVRYPEGNPLYFTALRFGSPKSTSSTEIRSFILTVEVLIPSNINSSENIFKFIISGQHYRSGDLVANTLPTNLDDFVKSLPPWHDTIPLTTLFSVFPF